MIFCLILKSFKWATNHAVLKEIPKYVWSEKIMVDKLIFIQARPPTFMLNLSFIVLSLNPTCVYICAVHVGISFLSCAISPLLKLLAQIFILFRQSFKYKQKLREASHLYKSLKSLHESFFNKLRNISYYFNYCVKHF